MLTFIEGLPQDVLAMEAMGKVTHDDYRNTLIPRAEEMMAHGPIKMLYVIGQDFTGFELDALLDDGAFGLKHWYDFRHIAVVTDHAWMRAMVGMFKPFFHGDVRLFGLSELAAAKDWITNSKKGAT
ncbi:MAG: STAS/SEC14 domain-containing protein [Aestuariivirga sp.]